MYNACTMRHLEPRKPETSWVLDAIVLFLVAVFAYSISVLMAACAFR